MAVADDMKKKTANVIGATGLVGRELTRQLLDDPRYETVRVFARRSTGLTGQGLDERLVDFERMESWASEIRGDELFSTLGTTLAQAGSQQRQHEIDYTYQWNAAEAAARNGVRRYLLVSSSGANRKSLVFYTKMKGELDLAVSELDFERVAIFRPSLLIGEREKPRKGERAAAVALKAVDWIPGLRRYKAIPGETVAAAMIAAANRPLEDKVTIFTLNELFELAYA